MSVTILGPLSDTGGVELPFYSFQVPAGFPSPAADHIEKKISLDELMEIRAPHMYLVRIGGDSMQGAGIFSGDLTVVDRAKEAVHGDVIIVSINCESTCKRLYCRDGIIILQSENPAYPPIHIMEGDDLLVWGVVRYSVRAHDKA